MVKNGETRNESAHEPLVDSATWHLTQKKTPVVERSARDGVETTVLRRLVRCAYCGSSLTRDSVRKPGKQPFYFFRCKNSGVCTQRVAIGVNLLEEFVLDAYVSEATVKVVEPRQSTEAYDAAVERVEAAEEEIRKFDLVWKESGLSAVDAVSMKVVLVQERDAAVAALQELPVEASDWRSQLEQEITTLLNEPDTAWRFHAGSEDIEAVTAQATGTRETAQAEGLAGDTLRDVVQLLRTQNPSRLRALLLGHFEKIVVSKGRGTGRVELVTR